MSVHCFLTSCTFQVAEVVSTVHPRAAIFLLPHDERLCLYFTFKELDYHWRKEKNMKKMKMSSPQDDEEEDNKDMEKEEEEDGDHLPAP